LSCYSAAPRSVAGRFGAPVGVWELCFNTLVFRVPGADSNAKSRNWERYIGATFSNWSND
jgi:hypothetical protein